MVEVDEQDVGLGAGSEAPEIVAAQELAAAEGGGIEDVAMLARLIVRVGDLGQDGRPA